MKILSVEKEIIDLGELSEFDEVPKMQFTVVDMGSDAVSDRYPDIIFPKLIYIEEYVGPALKCMIGEYETMLPLSWFTFIGEEDIGEVEVIDITSLNARNYYTIITNPIDGFRHYYYPIRCLGVYTEYEWILPKLKNGQAVAMPINDDNKNPLCMYVSHSKSKIPVSINSGEFL